MAFQTVISDDTRRILAELQNPRPIIQAGAIEAVEYVRNYYIEKNSKEPNKLRGRRTNFWTQVSRSVPAPEILPDLRIRIEITHPAISQKVYGGRIVPVKRRKLAIAIDRAAYGKSPFRFARSIGQKLFFIETRNKKLFLAGKGPSGETKFFYVLVDRVEQKPWPGSMPDLDKLRESAERGMVAAVNDILRRYESV